MVNFNADFHSYSTPKLFLIILAQIWTFSSKKWFRQLAFIPAFFNNTYLVYLSVLESRKSEAIRLYRSMQARFGPWKRERKRERYTGKKSKHTT